MKAYAPLRRLLCLLLALLLLPLPARAEAVNPYDASNLIDDLRKLPDPALEPYLSVDYADFLRVDVENDPVPTSLLCCYSVPQLNRTLSCADSVNAKILALFDGYLSADGGQFVLHGEEPFRFSGELRPDEVPVSDDGIVWEFLWDACLYNDVLSIRISRQHYRPFSLGFEYEESFAAFCVDINTGEELSGEELLKHLGLSRSELESLLQDMLTEISTREFLALEPEPYAGRDQELADAQQATLTLNPFAEVLERGVYLSFDGLQFWAYIDNGSRYLYGQAVTVDLWSNLAVWEDQSFQNDPYYYWDGQLVGGEAGDDPELRAGTDYFYLRLPESWRGHFTVEVFSPYGFSLYNSDNADAGFGGHLCDVYLSREIQSAQQLLDLALEESETVAENIYYLGEWYGGIVYAVADFDMPYNYMDPDLTDLYESMLRDIATFRDRLVVIESAIS